ncbi:glutamine cyclotransferase [Streptococcus iniae]|uniref:Glutamine cyclotransferase n=1 Tax=Streptococcus iniae TaxID=1346 RepID=A0A3L8G5P4_STRIN|nr:glutaminyl-peptide cyclotransferase [Streptococcus iniae]RLU53042.1 glutamine cyclotransferase [Streptococcus iniae]RLU56144.1 glutamine cyclotransferase [Streptococcus iniae]
MISKGLVSLVRTYSYDSALYTQGLEVLEENQVLVSAGRYGFSKVGLFQLDAQTFCPKLQFPDEEFAEGLTIVDDCFWVLTYKEGKAYKYNLTTFACEGCFSYEGDGWGLAYDKKEDCLWMTNGSAFLQKRHPRDFTLLETVLVAVDGVPISMLNELEYVDGYLYANIWQTNTIIKCYPNNGQLVATYDFTPILEQLHLDKEHYPGINVLNGIAYLGNHHFLISGKLYPKLLEVVLSDH